MLAEYDKNTSRYVWTLGIALGLFLGGAPMAAAQNLGTVTGTVVDAADGTPLIGAKVTLERLDAPGGARKAKTGTSGAFELASVRPGRYVLTVSSLGYQARRIPFTIELGEARNVDVELQRNLFSLDTVVEAPSRRRQRILEAPASGSVLEPRRIRREAATSSVEALQSVVGVDVAQTGVGRRKVALRGFNSAFSTEPDVRTDHRTAAASALGLNLYSVMPTTALDLDRIEAVRGPATLYGTDVDGGMLHFVTKDPFQDPGTSLALSGGLRDYLNVQFRRAGVLGDKVGYKFTGQWGRADEWALDPDHPQDAAELDRYRVYEDRSAVPTGRSASRVDSDDDGEPEFRLRREDLYRRYNVNGLVTYRFDRNTALSLRGGYASLTSPIQSPIGTLQASSFGYSYGQIRLETGEFLGQVALNHNPSGNFTYQYRTGRTIADDGTRVDGHLQYEFEGGPFGTEFLVGGEMDVTRLRDDPEIRGPVETERTTVGTYLQATMPLTSAWTLVLSGRGDYLSVREEIQGAPRAALVYTPAPSYALRASYARSVSVPSASLFLPVGPAEAASPPATVTQTWETGYKGQFGDQGYLTVDAYYETRANVLVPVEEDPVQYQNGGDIGYGGVDVAANLNVTESLSVFANTSIVTDDSFAGNGTRRIALNASARTVKGGFDYRLSRLDASIGVTAHHVEGFPVRYGPYAGTVEAYTLLDVRARVGLPSVPGLSVNVTAKNALDNDHREFIGAPALGRMLIVRVTYQFP